MGSDALAALSSIESTPATSQVKKYVMYYGSGKLSPDVIASALEKARAQNPTDLDLIHLQIYLFINHPAVQELPGRFRKELLPLTPMNTAGGGITLEFYAQLVFQLNLHEQFLQMVLAKTSVVDDLSKRIISFMLATLARDFNKGEVDAEVFKLYLLVIARLSSQDEDYMSHFNYLLDVFWMNTTARVTKFDKVQILLRLIGIDLVRNETLDKNSEITELIAKTDFDPTMQFCHSKTFKIFNAFYSTRGGAAAAVNSPCSEEFKALLGKFTIKGAMELTDDEKVELSGLSRGGESPLGLLGQYAHINQLILQSRPETTDTPYPLVEFLNFWSQFKPKSQFEDFADSIDSFEDLCRLLPVHATNPRYQRRWFEVFLRCYTEGVETSAGLRIIDGFIAQHADLELSVELINRLTNAAVIYNEAWGERVRTIILRIATRAYENDWKDPLVEGIYAGHAHDQFVTFGFGAELKDLINKAGALEIDPKAKYMGGAQTSALAKERSEYCKTVFCLFFENPIECSLRIVPAAVRARKFQVLHFVKAFLDLKLEKTGRVAAAVEISQGHGLGEFPRTPNLLEFCLLTLLKQEPQLELYEKNLCLLAGEGLLSFEQLYDVVFSVMERALCCEDYGRWLKVLRVWAALFDFLIKNKAVPIQEETAERFVEDILRLVTCSWMLLGALNHQPMLEGREKCLEMLELAKKHGLHRDEVKADIPEFHDAAAGLRELGVLWFKCPAAWAMVTKHLLAKPELIGALNQDQLVTLMIPWVTSACRLEWNAVLDFAENLIQLKGAAGGDISIHSVVNYMLVKAFQSRVRMSHYLAFYAHFLRRQQQQATAAGVAYRAMQKEHLNAVRTLLLFIQKIHRREEEKDQKEEESASGSGAAEGAGGGRRRRRRDEYRSGLVQQALLLLHEFVEWVILKSSGFESVQEEFLVLLAEAAVVASIEAEGCFSSMSIYKAIVTKLKRGKDDSTVFERSVSTMAPSSLGVAGACFQVNVKVAAGGAALKPEILENYASYYEQPNGEGANDKNEDEDEGGGRDGPDPALEAEEDDTRDLYPFHNTATEVGAKLSVQLKFED